MIVRFFGFGICEFHQIERTGILFDGFTQMTAEIPGFLDCTQAGVIISSLTAIISRSSMVGSGYSGIKVLTAGTLEMNETYLEGSTLQSILCESKCERK
jgi:hypothetical protein